jgi:hypothetical protein
MPSRLTRRTLFEAAAAAAAAPSLAAQTLSALDIARRHNLVNNLPTPNFFEGMLLGNGDIGVCVTLRPDALGLHLGKLDVWDIRVSDEHVQHLLPFKDVVAMWDRASTRAKPDATFLEISDPELRAYTEKVGSSYRKPWPRPWPCGTLWVHWDSRQVRLVRQELDLATGVYTAHLLHDDLRGKVEPFRLRCFVSWSEGHVLVAGDAPAPVLSIAYYPHSDDKSQMPAPEFSASAGQFDCWQRLPAGTAPSPNDRSFALHAVVQGSWKPVPQPPNVRRVWLEPASPQPLRLDLALVSSRDNRDDRAHAAREAARLSSVPIAKLQQDSEAGWRAHWSRSAVEFEDRDLERIWYRNQYFLACCLRPGKIAPGLFGNWTSGDIGTAWHGDYHMNYNTQQVFWGVFSSNHCEQHLPYVDLVEMLLPMARWNAREQFGLPGAYFPHSAYPVPSPVNPYPVPPWGYEICETPWTVQSLWWHYQYTRDDVFLRRVYPTLKEAAEFLLAYAGKSGDGKYHLNPSVSPENWGLTANYRLNRDCIIDIALTEFLLDALLEASKVLDTDAPLRPRWAEMRANLAPYPEAEGPYGRVWLDVAGAPTEHVYNVPVTLSPVWPAEIAGLGRNEQHLDIARRTLRTIRLEGGNDLVWLPLAHARLGSLDYEWFKSQVAYCLLPAGFANDRVRQIGGRYTDRTQFDYMMRMGVWTENLSLPAVLNECLLQSYTGVIRLFPNPRGLKPCRFQNLRAAGAFLVSASWNGREAYDVRIHSEKGAVCRLLNPWPGKPPRMAAATLENGVLQFPTVSGQTYSIDGGVA